MAEEIAPNLFFIERGWLNGNHFALTGPEPVLIDTGYITSWDETESLLSELGVVPASVRQIILTHTHCDHVGGVPQIQAASGCRVALHPVSAHYIRHNNSLATWWAYYDQQAEFFEVHQELNPGELLAVGDISFEIIEAPGHASGQICLFDAERRLLISADALWAAGLGVMTPRIEGLDCTFRALETLNRLESLKPERIYPGHGPRVDDPAEAFALARERLHRFIEEPRTQGVDQIKKIILYTLLMRESMTSATLFNNLVEMPWFGETLALFFSRERPRRVFDDIIEELLTKGALQAEGPLLTPTVKA